MIGSKRRRMAEDVPSRAGASGAMLHGLERLRTSQAGGTRLVDVHGDEPPTFEGGLFGRPDDGPVGVR